MQFDHAAIPPFTQDARRGPTGTAQIAQIDIGREDPVLASEEPGGESRWWGSD